MISVHEALDHLFGLITETGVETVPLRRAAGRVLAADVVASRDQPPFAASSMDGYAIRADEMQIAAMFKVVGESAAGHGYDGTVKPGQAVRIFTGAPIPAGASHVVIQEDVSRQGDLISIEPEADPKTNIRDAGTDFRIGDRVTAPRRLTPQDVALIAAMNCNAVTVRRKPVVAIISTGDELRQPGEDPGPNQIIASNSYGLAAMLDALGADARLLPIARDTAPALQAVFDLAAGADLIITIGGASVGDHDLVDRVTESMGMDRAFYKVAMRPGKPLMAGKLGRSAMIGLPGNPVSAMVCGYIFVAPVIRAMLGLGQTPAPRLTASLTADMPANGPREHYMRAIIDQGRITAFDRQDSSLLSVLAQSNALLVRPPNDSAKKAGETLEFIPL